LTSPTASAWQTFADLLDPPKNPYLNDPVGWATYRLGEFWWSGQRESTEMVVRNRYSTIKASHDVSKSHTVSRLACWWIDVHPPGEAFVVTTAPTTAQVEAILWRYIRTAHRKASLPGRITLDAKWYIGQELVGYGRKPPDRADVCAMAFSRRAQAAPVDIESHKGESITGDLMEKAW
jgi:hypothetical protein